MSRGSTRLDNQEYDDWLASNKKERELRDRHAQRKAANKADGTGWHFGIDEKPVYVKYKEDFRKELDKRGLAIKDEYGGRRA